MSTNNVTFLDYVNSHFGPSSPIPPLYHYTTMDALVNGIIGIDERKEGKEICLRATHCDYLNDTSEIQLGVKFLAEYYSNHQQMELNYSEKKKYIKDFKKLFTSQWKRYIISFSETNKSLPMWNTYSNRGNGIAIGFEDLDSLCIKDLLLKCVYDSQIIKEKFDEAQRNDVEGRLMNMLYMLTPSILKHEAYSYEQEVRLIGCFTESTEKYREKGGIVIPFKEVYLPKEKMTSITIGPAANQNEVEMSLKRSLDKRGFGHVQVLKSQIPYRNI